MKIFLYSSSVYSCHLFLISSAYLRSITFLPFIVPIFAWNIPLVPVILLKSSLAFLILLFSSISLHWLLRKTFLSLLAILWNSWLLHPVQCHEHPSIVLQPLWFILSMFHWALHLKITENYNDNLLLNVRSFWFSFAHSNTTFLLAWPWIFDINIVVLFSIPIFSLEFSKTKQNRQHLSKTYTVCCSYSQKGNFLLPFWSSVNRVYCLYGATGKNVI